MKLQSLLSAILIGTASLQAIQPYNRALTELLLRKRYETHRGLIPSPAGELSSKKILTPTGKVTEIYLMRISNYQMMLTSYLKAKDAVLPEDKQARRDSVELHELPSKKLRREMIDASTLKRVSGKCECIYDSYTICKLNGSGTLFVCQTELGDYRTARTNWVGDMHSKMFTEEMAQLDAKYGKSN